jgi:hypothetical protein
MHYLMTAEWHFKHSKAIPALLSSPTPLWFWSRRVYVAGTSSQRRCISHSHLLGNFSLPGELICNEAWAPLLARALLAKDRQPATRLDCMRDAWLRY